MQVLNKEKSSPMIPDMKIPIRLAFTKPQGIPSVISLWYVCVEEKIYCATQKTAKIVSHIQKNSLCGFEIARDNPPYKGTRGDGIAHIQSEKGNKILEILIKKYLGKKESTLTNFLRKNSKTEVAIEITPRTTFHYDYSKRMKDV